jgi:hypothetical protein
MYQHMLIQFYAYPIVIYERNMLVQKSNRGGE